jgi:hypothetical protein
VGTELRSLAQNPWVIENVDEAAVSPDGGRLALVIAGSYDKDGQSQNARLFVADAATGRSRTVVGKYFGPKWSPDGTRIAAFFDGGLAILGAMHRLMTLFGRQTVRAWWPVSTERTVAQEIRKTITSF